MEQDLKEHIAQIANFVHGQTIQPALVDALREVMTDNSPNATLLIRRIPVICNDVLWIKRALIGLYVLIGTGIIGIILANLGASIRL